MKRKILTVLIICFMPAVLLAVPDSVTINGLKSGAIITQGDWFEWHVYLSTPGESVTDEIWVDLNNNGIAEQGTDLLLVSFDQTDGGESSGGGLPDMDGEINGIIYFALRIAFAPANYIFIAKSGEVSAQATFRFNELSDPTYTISGKVVYSNGSPAPNTYVAAETEMTNPNIVFHWATLTDASGNYTIKTKASSGSQLEVRAKSVGNFVVTPDDTIITLNNNVENVNFTLVTAKIITGRVTNTNSQPLGNVKVIARLAEGGFTTQSFTDLNGIYYLGVSNGKYFVTFQHQDYIVTTYNQKYVEWLGDTVVVSESVDTVKNINAVLSQGGVITGKIRNGVCEGINIFTSEPLPGGWPYAWAYPYGETYSIMVPPGTYYVMFSRQQGAQQIWYNQKTISSQADQVIVGDYPDTVRNIDVDFRLLEVAEKRNAPREFKLTQNYPNPFNPSTILDFTIPTTGKTRLIVMNILGQEVAELYNGIAQAGVNYSLKFDGTSLASGVYFAKLEFRGKYLTKKLMLVK